MKPRNWSSVMQHNYFVDGFKVRIIKSTTSKKHIEIMHDWMRGSPMTRSVYALIDSGKWYRLHGTMWASRNEKEPPKPIKMAELVDAIIPTNWKEITSEIQVNSLFG